MALVRLTDRYGDAVFVNPALVQMLEESGEGETRLSIAGDAVVVKGTAEEVHAKLFPEAAGIVDGEMAYEVLERVANASALTPITLSMVNLAKAALGR